MNKKRIRIDYDNAIIKAKQLNDAAQTCIKQARDAENISNRVLEIWKGKSGNMMYNKLREWSAKQKKQGEKLISISNHIKTVAAEIKRLDEEMAKANRI